MPSGQSIPQTIISDAETQPNRVHRRRWRAALLITMAGAAGVLLAGAVLLQSSKTVTILQNGQAQSVQTRASTVGDLLTEIQRFPGPDDLVDPPPGTPLENGAIIRIRPAQPIRITVDGIETLVRTASLIPADILRAGGISFDEQQQVRANGIVLSEADLAQEYAGLQSLSVSPIHVVMIRIEARDAEAQTITVRSAADSVGELLDEQGIDVFLSDRVSPPLDTRITPNLTVTVEQVDPLTIHVDDRLITLNRPVGTVADALTQAGIALMGLDYTDLPLDASVDGVTELRVIRVKEVLETSYIPIPFETIVIAQGEPQAGRDGILSVLERVRMEDGVETLRTPVRDTVILQPQHAVVIATPVPEG